MIHEFSTFLCTSFGLKEATFEWIAVYLLNRLQLAMVFQRELEEFASKTTVTVSSQTYNNVDQI